MLAASHGLPELQRAILEGGAFAAVRHLRIMETAAGRPVDRVIASGGGAKTELWLRIKASVYGVPIAVPAEAECGIIGCAAMAQTTMGRHSSLDAAAQALVRYAAEIAPDPAWSETYARMQPLFDRLYRHSQQFYDELDSLAVPARSGSSHANGER